MDPFQDYHCPYIKEGWVYSYVTVDEVDGTPVSFTGPQGQEWAFYEYEQIFQEDDPELEAYCDSLTEGLDLYKYRWECWATGEFSSDDDFCSETYDILYEQYSCYVNAQIYTPQFCEADKLTNPEEPTAAIFQQCLFDISYFDFTRKDICDYAYPVDNEYFGEYNQGCLNYQDFERLESEEEELAPEDPEEPTETEQEEDEVTIPDEEEPEVEEDLCVSDDTTADVDGDTCSSYYDESYGG